MKGRHTKQRFQEIKAREGGAKDTNVVVEEVEGVRADDGVFDDMTGCDFSWSRFACGLHDGRRTALSRNLVGNFDDVIS